MPSFSIDDHAPLNYRNNFDRKRHETEMGVILKYSPYNTEEKLFKQFNNIPG